MTLLKELLKTATPRPWHIRHNPIVAGPRDEAIARMMQGGARMIDLRESAANMLLLTHSVNMLQKLVASLEKVTDYSGRLRDARLMKRPKREIESLTGALAHAEMEARAILIEANNVEVPN